MKNPLRSARVSRLLVVLVLAISVFLVFSTAIAGQAPMRRVAGVGRSVRPSAKPSKLKRETRSDGDEIKGISQYGAMGIDRITSEIMQAQEFAPKSSRPNLRFEREIRTLAKRKQNPDAPAVSSWVDPSAESAAVAPSTPQQIHTVGSNFIGATLTDTGAFPPDSMGAAGPSQFVVFVNGRIRTFNKSTGAADGVLNADPDVFFASVRTPVAGAVVLDFTSDPQARYDRFTGRWFLSIIDVPCTNATCTTTAANRLLIAVSDPGSSAALSGGTVWTFFQFQADPGTNFCDYPSLGVDVNALYVGCNMFSSTGSFVGTNGYVIQKASILGAGPIFTTTFANLAAGAGAGPEAPRGVDNYDSTATEGYFVGPDNATFSKIMFRRVSNPGSLAPTISANIPVTVPTTTLSGTQTIRLLEHAGNTGGNNGMLDSLDDRFYQAMIRNGRLWAAHNFTVSSAGVASTAATSRNAARWYEFQNLSTTPTVVQSGTVFDNAVARNSARQYWMPSVTVTGQGHAVMGMTMAGTPVGATPVFVGRLAGDTLGTMTGPPTTAAVTFGTTTANYNPSSDPGGTSGRRWGDYSYTMVDPLDDMTVWTIQDYNQALNSYAVQVARLKAPPPATPASTDHPSGVSYNVPSTNVVVTGTSSAGSGFYDPGTNLPSPAQPFTHISATVTGGVTVNSVTYNSPTQVTLNISTVGANVGGPQDVTITNPDGQSLTGAGLINVLLPTAAPASISGRVVDSSGVGIRRVSLQIINGAGTFTASASTDSFGYYVFENVPTGATYIITARQKGVTFAPEHIVYSHLDEVTNMNFTGTQP
jgi:hypothetical protein